MIIAALYLAAAGVADCRVVTDDIIRMRDLAAVEPAFSAVAADDSVVAYSPLPGSIRILQGAQLVRLAKRYGLAEVEFRDVCFQRAMRKLVEQELLDAFQQVLALPGAEVELVDFSRFPAPVGELVFPRSGLALTPSSLPLLWKGYVIYGGGQHFAVWAKVKVRARLMRVIATDNLVTGKPVRADQVRVEPLDGVPDALAPAQTLDQVVGKNLLRPVRRGVTVSLDDISTAIAIRRGDRVDVDFEAAGVHLRFAAAAETDGRLGDRVQLRNLQSRNLFAAEVSGKDQARVAPEKETNEDQTHRSGGCLLSAGDAGSGGEEAEGCR